jgi:hypothetical protein
MTGEAPTAVTANLDPATVALCQGFCDRHLDWFWYEARVASDSEVFLEHPRVAINSVGGEVTTWLGRRTTDACSGLLIGRSSRKIEEFFECFDACAVHFAS